MYQPGEPKPTERPLQTASADEYPIRQTPFVNAKSIILTKDHRFNHKDVNLSVSAVHVPTNEYDRGMNI